MDGIIFDVDGTLWDSTETVLESWTQAITENSNLDIDVSSPRLRGLFGKTMDEIYSALFPSLPKEEQQRLGDLCFAYENRLLETKPGILYEGVQEVFHTLSGKTPLFIVSNCQRGYIEIFLKVNKLEGTVKDHLCFGDTLVSKGQTILRLMEKNGLQDVVYVGDTQGDYLACQEAGIPFIFAEYGFGDVPEAEYRIKKLTDLLEFSKGV
ncbi:HAD family hydrolase [Muricomes intestini]|jgi:phosphoglycolate phosphatase|uniref:Phosphoglycolate phosphatase n=1 Tax=Muricomes intestini TaxID=1796634 RepID=A0A4V2US34_9FIRM|nr:HAD family hydrolase [Muricomes intestini]TCS79842.1 phosphoglycolate phosphatase [Muricomes intestini]HCR82305.1 HAD family hydrolase [Lachnospiraceae bacterium]